MVRSFEYRVEGNHPAITFYVSQHFWPRLVKALVWSLAWSVIGYACVRSFGFTVPSVIGLVLSVSLVMIGLVIVNFSVAWNTVWLRPEALRWREIRPLRWHTRSFPLLAIRDFGFALFSHDGPVLRLDVDGTWYVLASGIQEREAEALLLDIKQRGIVFPLPSSERLKDAYTSIPKFQTLD